MIIEAGEIIVLKMFNAKSSTSLDQVELAVMYYNLGHFGENQRSVGV